MLLKKILISTVILLAVACTPSKDSAAKGPSPPHSAVASWERPVSHQQRTALVIGNSDYAGNK